MKQIILALSLLVGTSAFAGPVESVDRAVGKLLEAVQISNPSSRAAALCSLARGNVDSPTISNDLLGNYRNSPNDSTGVQNFRNLVPSIIVSEFYNRLSGLGTAYTVNPNTVPKGSGRIGVIVNVGSRRLTVTVNSANNRVLDVEYIGISLVKHKRAEYQRDLNAWASTGKPVSKLVESLINSGNLIRCN